MKRPLIVICLTLLTLPSQGALIPTLRPSFHPAALLRSLRWLDGNRNRTDRYDALIVAYSRRRGLDPRLVKSIIAAESGFSPTAISPAGARGLMQVMPATAREMGVDGDLDDPALNIRAGTAYLEFLHRLAWKRYALKGRRYLDTPAWVERRIVAAYNAGPRALSGRKWVKETRLYVEKVAFYRRRNLTVPRLAPNGKPAQKGDGRLAGVAQGQD